MSEAESYQGKKREKERRRREQREERTKLEQALTALVRESRLTNMYLAVIGVLVVGLFILVMLM